MLSRIRKLAGRSKGPNQDPTAEVYQFLVDLKQIDLALYEVVPGYYRYDDLARQSLIEFSRLINLSLFPAVPSMELFLLHGPSGEGKSYLVKRIVESLSNEVQIVDINLAALDQNEFRKQLQGAGVNCQPSMCLIDEVQSWGNEDWPFQTLLGHVGTRPRGAAPQVVILASSHGETLQDLRAHIGSRTMGVDVLNRIPVSHQWQIPPLSRNDRVIVGAAQLRMMARQVREVEKLALYYMALSGDIGSGHQLRDLVKAAVGRMPTGEKLACFSYFFAANDPAMLCWHKLGEIAGGGLTGQFTHITDS